MEEPVEKHLGGVSGSVLKLAHSTVGETGFLMLGPTDLQAAGSLLWGCPERDVPWPLLPPPDVTTKDVCRHC